MNNRIEQVIIQGDNGGVLPFDTPSWDNPFAFYQQAVYLTRASILLYDPSDAGVDVPGYARIFSGGQIWGPNQIAVENLAGIIVPPINAGQVTARDDNDFVGAIRVPLTPSQMIATVACRDATIVQWLYVLRLEFTITESF